MNILLALLSIPVFLILSSKSFSQCNPSDIPAGAGIVNSGTTWANVVEDNGSASGNPSTGVDGSFAVAFSSYPSGNAAQCGSHADGTLWLAPIAGDTDVRVSAVTSNSTIYLEDNPEPTRRGFMDNSLGYPYYDATANVIGNLPINYPLDSDPITSLLLVLNRGQGCGTASIQNECVKSLQHITVYDQAPENGGANTIRPTMFGTSKNVYTWDDLDRSRLNTQISEAQHKYTDAQVDVLLEKWTATTESYALDICGANYSSCVSICEGGRCTRSHDVINNYASNGAQMDIYSYLLSDAADVINDNQDKALLAAVVAYGIDVITLVEDPPDDNYSYTFQSGAGQFMNMAVFSYLAASLSEPGTMLWDAMAVTARNMVDLSGVDGPQELQQICPNATWGDGCSGTNASAPFSSDGLRFHWEAVKNSHMKDKSEHWVTIVGDGGTTYNTGFSTECNISKSYQNDNSFCRDSYVVAGDVLLTVFDYQTIGSNIVFNDPVESGSIIRIAQVFNTWEGWLGGKRTFGDPHGYIDGPGTAPGTGYFGVANGSRFRFVGAMYAIPQLCQVVNYDPLVQFVERYLATGLQTAPDACAPPTDEDLENGCTPYGNGKDCVDYYLGNNGTVKWGPDPRDISKCVTNNTVLTSDPTDPSGWIESFEDRGDNGRYTLLNGIKSTSLPLEATDEFLAFKGDNVCGAIPEIGTLPTPILTGN